MVERGEDYAVDLDRLSISRWENGSRLAPREFLVAFGRSLRVPKSEMDRMLSLAGYESLGDDEGRDAMLAAARSIEFRVESLHREVRSLVDSAATPEPSVDTYGVVREALRRMVLPGIYALALGFLLNALGLNGTLALVGYVLVSLAIVIGQGVLRWLKPESGSSEHDHIVDLFFISVFFTLNASLLIGALTKVDHFGFYTVDAFINTPMPFLFSILVNLALSLVASIMFSVLWRRQGSNRRHSAFQRVVWTTLPPLLLTYISLSVFTNLGAWISFLVILAVLFGAFTTILALNEPGISLGDEVFVLKAAIPVIDGSVFVRRCWDARGLCGHRYGADRRTSPYYSSARDKR